MAIAIVAGAVVYYLSNSEAKKYRSSTEIYVQTASPVLPSTIGEGGGDVASPTQNELGDVAQLITSASVTADVEKILKESPGAIGSVGTSASSTSDFVTIDASGNSAEGSARLANAYAQAYLNSRRASLIGQAQAAITAAKQTLATATDRTDRQAVLANVQSFQEVLLDPNIGATQPARAQVPSAPYAPTPKSDTLFAVIVGLVVGVLLAYGFELLNVRIEGAGELEEIFERPALAVLPEVPDPSPFADAVPSVPDQFIEPLRMLRFQMRLNPDAGEPKTILVTSGVQNEGKSTLVRDLALTYSRAGQRVLVVDADVRRQSLARLLRVRPENGFVDILLDGSALADVAEPAITSEVEGGGGVDLLVSGTSGRESVNLLALPEMRDMLAEASSSYDAIIIDTAPLLMVADSTPLLPAVDAILVVARLGLVDRQSAKRLAETLRRLDVAARGVIVNGQNPREADLLSYGQKYGDVDSDGRHRARLSRGRNAS